MRQVPHYLIIGNGQMASHTAHYFRYLSIPYQQWDRTNHNLETLHRLSQEATHVLVLISDTHIETFITEHLDTLNHTKIIHFSGCLSTTLAYSAHPLCTFSGKSAYPLSDYQRIPFITEKGSPPFSQLLPGLSNPSYPINPSEKPYYHALCVIANNFTGLLWEKFFREMETRFSVDAKDLMIFLEKTVDTLSHYPNLKLTGPLIRGDTKTLDKDLNALAQDPFHSIFKSFIDTYKGKNDA